MSVLSLPNRSVSFVAAAAMFIMAVTGAADVLARLMNRPLAGSYELIETLMVFVVFLGIAKAEEQNRHVSVTLLVNVLPSSGRILLSSFGSVLSAILFCMIAYFGWAEGLRSFATGEVQPGEIGLPLWPARFILAIGSTMMLLQCLVKILDDLRCLTGQSS